MDNNNSNEKTEALSEHEIRVNKANKLKDIGIEPWPYREKVSANCGQVKEEYKENIEKKYSIAGRVITIRVHGKTGFCTVQDRTGQLQVYIKKDLVGEQVFNFFKDYLGIASHFSGRA